MATHDGEIERRLAELGVELDETPLDNGRFLRAQRAGDLVYTSGSVSSRGDAIYKGRIGRDLSIEDGRAAARVSAIRCLEGIRALIGDLDNVVQIIKLVGIVNGDDDFSAPHEVVHGATDFLVEVFGPRGQHARTTFVGRPPSNHAVEIELVVQVKGETEV